MRRIPPAGAFAFRAPRRTPYPSRRSGFHAQSHRVDPGVGGRRRGAGAGPGGRPGRRRPAARAPSVRKKPGTGLDARGRRADKRDVRPGGSEHVRRRVRTAAAATRTRAGSQGQEDLPLIIRLGLEYSAVHPSVVPPPPPPPAPAARPRTPRCRRHGPHHRTRPPRTAAGSARPVEPLGGAAPRARPGRRLDLPGTPVDRRAESMRTSRTISDRIDRPWGWSERLTAAAGRYGQVAAGRHDIIRPAAVSFRRGRRSESFGSGNYDANCFFIRDHGHAGRRRCGIDRLL